MLAMGLARSDLIARRCHIAPCARARRSVDRITPGAVETELCRREWHSAQMLAAPLDTAPRLVQIMEPSRPFLREIHSGVAQSVEQVAVNHRVGGSSPSAGARNQIRASLAQLVNGPDVSSRRRVFAFSAEFSPGCATN